jgi:opacity protein-like surface antigen
MHLRLHKLKTALVMKKTILALLAAGICAATSVATAATPYLRASIGAGFMSNSNYDPSFPLVIVTPYVADAVAYKSGVSLDGAVGLKIGSFRVEEELGYQTSKVEHVRPMNNSRLSPVTDGASMDMLTYMTNIYYDLSIRNSPVAPYVMIGLGGAHVSYSNASSSVSGDRFASQFGAGVGIRATEQLTVDIGWRSVEPFDFEGLVSMQDTKVMAGVRYTF